MASNFQTPPMGGYQGNVGPTPTQLGSNYQSGNQGIAGTGTGGNLTGLGQSGNMGGLNAGSGGLLGNGEQPGLFGTGQYQAPSWNIDMGAFNNPAGNQAGNLNSALGSYISNTTVPVTAAQAGAGNYGNYNTGIAGQLGLAQQYQNMAAGNGPSLATVTAQQQGQANLAASESMLGSARGAGNPAAAQLAARTAQTQGAQQVAANAVQGRTAEELGAMNAAAGLYGNVAGQGLNEVGLEQGLGEFNAGQSNQVGMSNQQNNLNAYTNYLGNLSTQNLAQLQSQMAGQQLGVQQQLGLDQIQAQAYQNAAQNNKSAAGGFFSGIGGFLGGLF